MALTHSHCHQSAAVVTVVNVVRRSEFVVNNHRQLRLQHLRHDAKAEQEA